MNGKGSSATSLRRRAQAFLLECKLASAASHAVYCATKMRARSGAWGSASPVTSRAFPSRLRRISPSLLRTSGTGSSLRAWAGPQRSQHANRLEHQPSAVDHHIDPLELGSPVRRGFDRRHLLRDPVYNYCTSCARRARARGGTEVVGRAKTDRSRPPTLPPSSVPDLSLVPPDRDTEPA